MPLYFFNFDTTNEQELQNRYNAYIVDLELIEEIEKKLPIFLKQMQICIQLGEIELNKVNIDIDAVFFHYRKAINAYDGVKEIFTELNYSKYFLDVLLNKIQTSLGQPLERHFAKTLGPTL